MDDYGYANIGKLADFANNTIGGLTANDIMRFPRADVQPVKHGRWIEVSAKHSKCSICDTTCLIAVYPISKNANYCPNCGARMDGQEVEEDV